MVYSDCSHDSVEILDGDNYQAPSVGKDYICSSRNLRGLSHTLDIINETFYERNDFFLVWDTQMLLMQ